MSIQRNSRITGFCIKKIAVIRKKAGKAKITQKKKGQKSELDATSTATKHFVLKSLSD